MLQINLAIVVTFRQFATHIAVFLLRIDIADKALLRLKVEGHRVALIRVVTHSKHRRARKRLTSMVGRIAYARGMH